jgi:RNA polymerase sigma-70 factor (ECF subfamily)
MTPDFTATYNHYQDVIFRFCLTNCRDRELGQDLTQETFLRFWLCLERKEDIRHERGFLYHIARNLIIDHVRRKKETSLDQLMETGYEPTIDTWHETYSRLDAERPLQALRAMEPQYRMALHSRFIKGFTPMEIAKQNGETPNTVSVRIFRGLKHLRLALK